MTLHRRALGGYALVAASPAVAWLTWVSRSEDKASDAMHVMWFATVAAACFVAGALAPRRPPHLAMLTATAVAATMTTLTWWWSAADPSGLFAVGLVLALPPVTVGAASLLLLGRLLVDQLQNTRSTTPRVRRALRR